MVLGTRRRLLAALATVGAAITLALVVSGRGCIDADASPEGAARAFVAAARAGDRHALWDLLGPRTRERLTDLAASATAKAGGTRRFAALDMLDATPAEGAPPVEVAVAWRDAAAATVVVRGPGGAADRLALVKTPQGWRVELPAPSGP